MESIRQFVDRRPLARHGSTGMISGTVSDIFGMFRVYSMRWAMIAPRWRGEGCAASLAAALILSGCSSASTPTEAAGSGVTSRFSSLFSGSASPAAQAAGGPGIDAADCPNVEIRTGAGTLTVGGKPPEASATDVRYQLTFTELARQCMVVGADLVVKVGVQGRIIVGPVGGPGPIDIPLRYAVVREGAQASTIATKFKRLPADVPPGQANVVFSDVEENLSFPMPSRAALASYIVYVGFDEIGEGAEKKPAVKKPAAKGK
jgi:hypothetical protein